MISFLFDVYFEEGDSQEVLRRLSNSGSESSDHPPELPPRTPSRTFPGSSVPWTQLFNGGGSNGGSGASRAVSSTSSEALASNLQSSATDPWLGGCVLEIFISWCVIGESWCLHKSFRNFLVFLSKWIILYWVTYVVINWRDNSVLGLGIFCLASYTLWLPSSFLSSLVQDHFVDGIDIRHSIFFYGGHDVLMRLFEFLAFLNLSAILVFSCLSFFIYLLHSVSCHWYLHLPSHIHVHEISCLCDSLLPVIVPGCFIYCSYLFFKYQKEFIHQMLLSV